MKVALRVDASPQIGTGHLRRCWALAMALRDAGAQPVFVLRDLGLPLPGWLADAGFDIRRLAAPAAAATAAADAVPHAAWAGVPASRDAEDTIEALRAEACAWVVVDHYALDARWHQAVAAALGCRIAAIDDLADRALDVDLLVDHNHDRDHRQKYAGRVPARARLLVGPRHALLGPSYRQAPRCAPADRVRSIGVFMGGVDAGNATALALQAIAEAGFDGPVEVVATAAHPQLAALRRAAAARPGTTLQLDLPDLADFFARHDLQIGAGGGASWERCCVGAPTLALVLAANQLAVVPQLQALGVLATPQPLGTQDAGALAATLRELLGDAQRRHLMSEQACRLVDGLGARRVALALAADHLSVRRARPEDAGLLHAWRNHPDTRRVSRDPREIAPHEHHAWLQRTLADPARSLYVAEVGHLPVGSIRFDRLNSRRAEVSLYLDPALHGLGLGTALLRAGERQVPPDHDLIAEVLDNNPTSARLFAAAGYHRHGGPTWIKPAAARLAPAGALE